jgi:hypothetical protein
MRSNLDNTPATTHGIEQGCWIRPHGSQTTGAGSTSRQKIATDVRKDRALHRAVLPHETECIQKRRSVAGRAAMSNQ